MNEHYIHTVLMLVLDPAERIRVPGLLGYTNPRRLQPIRSQSALVRHKMHTVCNIDGKARCKQRTQREQQ